jgi:putative lipoprotein
VEREAARPAMRAGRDAMISRAVVGIALGSAAVTALAVIAVFPLPVRGQGRTTASAPALWRGMFLDVPTSSATFAPCGDRLRYRVLDETPDRDLWQVYRDVTHDRAQRIYLEVIAQRRGSRLEVLELRRALVEGLGCHEDLRDIRVKAVGNEPFWRLQVETSAVRFEHFGDEGWSVFPAQRFASSDGALTLETASESLTLSVRITPERCHDTVADAVYGFTAVVTVRGTTYRGCAYEGEAPGGLRDAR